MRDMSEASCLTNHKVTASSTQIKTSKLFCFVFVLLSASEGGQGYTQFVAKDKAVQHVVEGAQYRLPIVQLACVMYLSSTLRLNVHRAIHNMLLRARHCSVWWTCWRARTWA
eukprot:957763-Pelagomonas_calceolata.AAC.1